MGHAKTVLTISDVAEVLQVSEKTITRMIQDGSIPAFKVANQWRFHPDDFDRWMDEKRSGSLPSTASGIASMLSHDLESPSLSRLTDEGLVILNVDDQGKNEILQRMAAPLVDRGLIKNPEGFLQGLNDREAMMSTGIGGGVALPHLRHPGELPLERPVLVIGIAPSGVDWDALDGETVKLFLMPVSGDEVIHLRILAGLRRYLGADGFLNDLLGATTPRDVMKTLMTIETLRSFG